MHAVLYTNNNKQLFDVYYQTHFRKFVKDIFKRNVKLQHLMHASKYCFMKNNYTITSDTFC